MFELRERGDELIDCQQSCIVSDNYYILIPGHIEKTSNFFQLRLHGFEFQRIRFLLGRERS